MEQDYELEEDYAPRILWGRLAFFLLAVVLAFSVGRCTKSSGVEQETFAAEQQRVLDLQEQNTILQQQLDAAETNANQGRGGGNNNGGAAGDDPTEGTESESPVADGQTTYTVQENDTLTTIAEEFYGDQSKFDLIVDANNLTEDTPLRVGQELVIPQEP